MKELRCLYQVARFGLGARAVQDLEVQFNCELNIKMLLTGFAPDDKVPAFANRLPLRAQGGSRGVPQARVPQNTPIGLGSTSCSALQDRTGQHRFQVLTRLAGDNALWHAVVLLPCVTVGRCKVGL